MSIQRIGPDNVEFLTLKTQPRREYASSSAGVTGLVSVFPRASLSEKEVKADSVFNDSMLKDDDLQHFLDDITEITSSNIHAQMEEYLNKVNEQPTSVRKQQTIEVIRFEPSYQFTSDTLRKSVVQRVLYPYYRSTMSVPHWAFTNYHSINFFTGSGVPSNTVLLFPNSASNVAQTFSGSYVISDAFTFEFYLNPRYTSDAGAAFKAGTLLHLSSTFAVSLVSGTSRGPDDRPDGFRLLLQVSGGADAPPSSVVSGQSLCFFSDDNSLSKNHWHHVAIRWAATANDRTGSFIIDGVERGAFVIPHSTIAPAPITGRGNADVLCVGNFYEGNNTGGNSQALFFNQNIANREGLVQLIDDGDGSTNTPAVFAFNHPLNAEVHELKIHSEFRTLEHLSQSQSYGTLETGSLLFYLPPFFTKESPRRKPYGSNDVGWLIGGVMQTPFESVEGTTDDPFNVAMSFGVGGHLVNLENFLRDFATGNYPRLLHLSASEIGVTTNEAISANSLLYDELTSFNSGSVRKRNITVLPNDNGLFYPEFGLLGSGTVSSTPESGSLLWNYTNDLGNLDLSLVSLTDLIPSMSFVPAISTGSLFQSIAGASPETPGVSPGSVLTVFQRTRDNSSNEVVFFDISNIYYGDMIAPSSFAITDPAITGSSGKLGITLRDNGHGGLYRADALTKHAEWSNVGDIFYNEGIVVIKSPMIPFFGKDSYEMTFKGEKNLHIMRLNVPARSGEVNSSSNPTYTQLSASYAANETDARFVYITGINFHDENLNVVMKSRLAQPIAKRFNDKLLFRVKYDF